MARNEPQHVTSNLRILILTPNSHDSSSRDNPSAAVTASSSSSSRQSQPSPLPAFLHRLTDVRPSPDITSFAGYTSHAPLSLKTKYYSTSVSIWCDEFPTDLVDGGGDESKIPSSESQHHEKNVEQVLDSNVQTSSIDSLNPSSVDDKSNGIDPTIPPSNVGRQSTTPTTISFHQWQSDLLSPPALEVRQAIGAIILVLPFINSTSITNKSSSSTTNTTINKINEWSSYIESISTIRDAIEDETGREVASVVVIQNVSPSPLMLKPAVTTTEDGITNISKNDQLSKLQQSSKNRRRDGKIGEMLLEKLEDECLSSRGVLGWDFVSWKGNTTSSSSSSAVISGSDSIDVGTAERNEGKKEEEDQTRNEFGEKTGFSRVIEVLEGVDWFASSFDDDDDDGDDGQELDDTVFDDVIQGDQELQREMLGLKMAMLDINVDNGMAESDHNDPENHGLNLTSINDNKATRHDDVWASLDATDNKDEEGDDLQVDQLQGLMQRVIAIREAGSEMSKSEREKFARREIQSIMKYL